MCALFRNAFQGGWLTSTAFLSMSALNLVHATEKTTSGEIDDCRQANTNETNGVAEMIFAFICACLYLQPGIVFV